MDGVFKCMLDIDMGVYLYSMLVIIEELVDCILEEVVGMVVVIGDQGLIVGVVEMLDSFMNYLWGKWDEVFLVFGVKDVQVFVQIIDVLLLMKYKVCVQYMKKFVWIEGVLVLFVDYWLGDFV